MMRILIVDDHVAEATLIAADPLRAAGYGCSLVNNPANLFDDRLRIFSLYNPHMLVTGRCTECVMTGIDLVKDVRRRGKRIPIIMMSGTNIEALALEAGANAFVNKLNCPQELLDVVRELAPQSAE
jgi:DNA-binding response OmpR family regulator